MELSLNVNMYDRIDSVESFVSSIGDSIAKSMMFGCESVDQGRILALECLAKRVPPLSLAESYHMIQGKLSMKSDKMLSNLLELGGKYVIHERSAEAAEATFTYGDNELRCCLTWQDAMKEPFVYEGKEKAVCADLAAGKQPPLKPKYQTPRARMQMLWARLVSDSVGFVCPKAKHGIYTPEEVADFDELQPAVSSKSAAKASVVPQQAPKPEPTADVIDVPFDVAPVTATGEQTERIRQLYEILSIPYEKQQQILKDRGAEALRNLELQQAHDLITKLEAMVDQSKSPADAVSAPVEGPALQTTIDAIKEQIGVAVQSGMPSLADEVKQKLQQAGMQRLADLTEREGQRLLKGIGERMLQEFFDADLRGHAPKN